MAFGAKHALNGIELRKAETITMQMPVILKQQRALDSLVM
jgi:hypothetical protein